MHFVDGSNFENIYKRDLRHHNVISVLGVYQFKTKKFLVSEKFRDSTKLPEFLAAQPELTRTDQFDMYENNLLLISIDFVFSAIQIGAGLKYLASHKVFFPFTGYNVYVKMEEESISVKIGSECIMFFHHFILKQLQNRIWSTNSCETRR